jgi:PAS domain S-box-containing protein
VWQYHPLLIIFALGGIVSAAVTLYCWQYMQRYGSSYLVGGLGLIGFNNAIWCFAATLKTASESLQASLLFYKIEFFVALNPALGVVVALAYAGKERWLSRPVLGVLLAPSAVFILLIFATPGDVMIVEPKLVPAQGIMAFEHEFPPLFAVYFAWIYGLTLLTLGIIANGMWTDRVPRVLGLVAILLFAIPLVVNMLKSTGIYPPGGKGINVTPAASAVSVTLLAFALVRYRVFELIPVSRDWTVEIMTDGYLLVHESGTILDANPVARQLLTGLDDAPLKNRSVEEVMPVREKTDENNIVQFTSGSRTIEARRSKVTRQNQAAGEVFLLQDVTEREKRKQELERYERVMENIPVGVYRVTPGDKGELIFGNQALAEILGADSVEELNDYTAREFYADPEERAERSDRLLSEGEITNEVIRMQRLDGEEFWALLSNARAIEDGAVYFEGAIQDVTERKEYQEELKRARKRVRSERDGKEAIRQLLLQNSTDREIAESVCQLLVESHGYAGAWIVRKDGNGDVANVSTVVSHGDDYGFRVQTSGDDPADGKFGDWETTVIDEASRRTLEESTAVAVTAADDTGDALLDALEECGLYSVRSVALEYNGISYGALTVVRREPGGEFSQELVNEVAAAIAFKQQVHRQQDALTANTVVELTVRLTGEHFFGALSRVPSIPTDATLSAHELQSDGSFVTYLVECPDVDPEVLRGAAADLDHVEETALVAEEASTPVIRVRVAPPTLGTVLRDHGGAIQSMTASGGRVELTAQFPRRTDVSAVVEAIQTHWPEATMRTRNERTLADDHLTVFEGLTEKQEAALRAATLAGFFQRPQQASADDVAETLGVSRSTFLHHLRRAEQKIFDEAFKESPERLRSQSTE